MENKLKSAKVLVTGGTGFIGSHIFDALREKGYEAMVLDNALDNVPPKITDYLYCDIRDFNEVHEVFSYFQPEYVVHCAAKARIQPSFENPLGVYQTNVMGTLNILECARKFGVKKIIYSGSSSVYAGRKKLPLKEIMKPKPLNPYAYSKLMAEMLIEQYVKNFGLKAVILRYFNVYGPRQPEQGQYATVIGIFLRQWKNKEPFTIVPDGLQRRDFTYVFDVVRANIMAMESDAVHQGEVINIGSGQNYSILEMAEIIGGKDYPTVFIEPRVGEARATLADISKAKKLLGWQPQVSFQEGIEFLKKQM